MSRPRRRTRRLQVAARDAIEGRSRGLKAILPFIGPAFIACIAYIDPGNFATNIQGGAEFGYALLWVILLANVMAMLLQSLSAKLGIATGMNLAEVCRHRFPKWVNYILWITQEVTAMATDLAEVLGAAIGITLLTGMPMLASAVITGSDRLHHPGDAGQGLPPARDLHRRVCRGDRRVLRDRDDPGEAGLGPDPLPQRGAQPAG